jgi:hypothetical protein
VELSTAQAGARGVRDIALIHYPLCTDSIKPSSQFSCYFVVINASKGSLWLPSIANAGLTLSTRVTIEQGRVEYYVISFAYLSYAGWTLPISWVISVKMATNNVEKE